MFLFIDYTKENLFNVSGLPHTQGIQGNSWNFQVIENLRETQGILILFLELRETQAVLIISKNIREILSFI